MSQQPATGKFSFPAYLTPLSASFPVSFSVSVSSDIFEQSAASDMILLPVLRLCLCDCQCVCVSVSADSSERPTLAR